MKVLFVMHNNNRYSGANLAMQEVISLLSSDIEKIVLYPEANGSAQEYFNNLGIKTYNIPYWPMLLSETDGKLKNIVKYPLLLVRWIKMKRNCKLLGDIVKSIDCIYTNSSSVLFGLLLSKAFGIPHIWHIREFCDLDHKLIFPFGKKHYFSLANKIKSEIIVISKCLYESRKEYFDEKKMHLIYDDVDESYINLKKNMTENEICNILIAGDIKEGKGQLIAVQAMTKLNRGQYHLYIVGKVGNQEYKNKIDQLIFEQKMEDMITFTGHVSDMNSLRRNMDIGIVASNSEAFGRVTVEGMLSGMAMVGRNSGATPEILDDNCTGLLYDGSSDDLARKIEMLSDIRVRKKISENGFKKAASTYVKGNCAIEIEQIIKKVIG